MKSDKPHAYLDEYRILKTLGAGYHAKVRLGQSPQGQLVAIKQYKKQTATLETLKRELKVMQNLHHQNIVRLISVRQNATYRRKDGMTYSSFAIVMEYIGGAQLFDFVVETGQFSQKVARTYFHQLMNGIYYIHQRGFAHRDIKPQNILLSEVFVLKLTDFGFSCALEGKDGSGILRMRLGTQGYMAPEIQKQHYDGKQIDIFACGVILFVMFAGNPPFTNATVEDPYYRLIIRKQYQTFWSAHSRKRAANFFNEHFKNLFERMVAFEPNQRPSIEQIAQHPWVCAPICSHSQIKNEFMQRQKQLDKIKAKKKLQQQIANQQKISSIKMLSILMEASSKSINPVDKTPSRFMSYYNEEFTIKRELPALEEQQHYHIRVKDKPEMVIAGLKQFLQRHQIVLDQAHSSLFIDDHQILRMSSMVDHNDQIILTYNYTYDVQKVTFDDKIVLSVTLRTTKNNKGTTLLFTRIQGNNIYFKKIVQSIRLNCFAH